MMFKIERQCRPRGPPLMILPIIASMSYRLDSVPQYPALYRCIARHGGERCSDRDGWVAALAVSLQGDPW